MLRQAPGELDTMSVRDGQTFLLPVRKAVGAPVQVVANWQAGWKT
jgi:hypothetical protein